MNYRILLRPVYLARRLALMLYERRHPEHPWIAAGAIAYCSTHLSRTMKGLEWGSGRSTLWWAGHLDSLMSVEQNQQWYEEISKQIHTKGITNVDYRYIPVDDSLTGGERQMFPILPPYVAVANEFQPESLDFVVVDGHYRLTCVRAIHSKIKPGGLLLIDNFNWLPPEDWEIPSGWVKVCDDSNALTKTVIWKKPDQARSFGLG